MVQSLVSFEHEHVINPVVTVGQKVTAGDVLATVSDYNPHWKAKGLGVVEIGILSSKKNSNQAWHARISSFLDPARKSALLQAMESAMAAWESELSDPTVFDERAMPIVVVTPRKKYQREAGSRVRSALAEHDTRARGR